MNNVKWVLFDWRDTLTDSQSAIKVLNEKMSNYTILNTFGVKCSIKEYLEARNKTEKEKVTKFKGNIIRHIKGRYFKELARNLGKELSWKDAEKMEDRFTEQYDKMIKLNPGARDTLDFLKFKGIHIALISNVKMERIQRQLNNLAVLKYFDFIVTSFEAGGEKSSLKPFKLFLDKANAVQKTKPEECIMVGDRADEDAHAKEMGFYAVLFNPKDTKKSAIVPDKIVANFTELLALLKTLVR